MRGFLFLGISRSERKLRTPVLMSPRIGGDMANALQTRRIQLRADSRLDTRQRTPEGYLRADTALVRVGVMAYSAGSWD